ncbi:MAG: putative metal-binding motif-containing protein [Sandaracinaceae bacterium]
MLTLRSSRPLWVLLLASALSVGCSALINPDESRLGDPPDAGEEMDGAVLEDADVRDSGVDADVRDGGPEDAGPEDAGPEDGGRDAGPGCDLDCDDGIPCTEDTCLSGSCVHTPDDASCGDGARCSPVDGCVPNGCASNAECNDGFSCTRNRCVDGACVITPDDGRCDDETDCTVDRCAPGAGSDERGCVNAEDDARCGDFCTVGARCSAGFGCFGGAERDCLDGNFCTADSCDPVAEACVNVPRDDDEDGAPAASVGGMMCTGGTDCNDGNAGIRPGVDELCDGVDNNGNGETDEGCSTLPDTCATAEAIPLDGDGRGRASGTFAALGNEYVTSPLCGASTSGGRDAIYFVDLPSGTWDVTIDTLGSVADTVLGLSSDCSEDALALICNNDMDPGRTDASRIFGHRLQAGGGGLRLFILVEGDGAGEGGDYVVNVSVESARPDACSTIGGGRPLDITGGGTVLGSQLGFAGTRRGSCMPLADLDDESVLSFTSTSTAPQIDVYSADFTPDLFVREGCGSDGEVACARGSNIGGGIGFVSVTPAVMLDAFHSVYVDGRGSYVLFYLP